MYKYFSVLKALDYCFKIYHVLNLKYPKQSAIVWQFVQTFFYKIKTPYDGAYMYSSIYRLIKEI